MRRGVGICLGDIFIEVKGLIKGAMGSHKSHIGAVVLTYNSVNDLAPNLEGLKRQEGVDLRVIVVDNASSPEERAHLVATFREKFADGVVMEGAVGSPEKMHGASALFVTNDVNGGYSAGNNIGARIAVASGCDAVLIVNPDVRIDHPRYLRILAERMMREPKYVVAASRMRNLAGKDENPMMEPGFLQELTAPLRMAFAGLGLARRSVSVASETTVGKVSGSCFMIRSSFLEEIGYFDEQVFLYCEESILAAQVQRAGKRIVLVPEIEALHAHKAGEKGDPVRRYANWARSRRYYHRVYARYGPLRRALLTGAQFTTLGLVALRELLSRVRGMSKHRRTL